jgi:hypothetical protein
MVVRAGITPNVVSSDARKWVVLRWYDNEASPVLPQLAFAALPFRSLSNSSTRAVDSSTTAAASPETEEPVKVYRPEGSTPSAAPSPAAPDKNAPASPAAAPPKEKEILKVYHASGSGAAVESPQPPKKP